MNALLEDNRRALRQGLALIATLDSELYGDPGACRVGAPIGAHFRHVLDHFTAFFAGLDAGMVEYEQRERDIRVERDSALAQRAAEGLIARLDALIDTPDRPIVLVCRVGAEAEGSEGLAPSSVKRELQFLLSHTHHHYALISAELRVRGREVPDSFGIAPSTLGYRRGIAA